MPRRGCPPSCHGLPGRLSAVAAMVMHPASAGPLHVPAFSPPPWQRLAAGTPARGLQLPTAAGVRVQRTPAAAASLPLAPASEQRQRHESPCLLSGAVTVWPDSWQPPPAPHTPTHRRAGWRREPCALWHGPASSAQCCPWPGCWWSALARRADAARNMVSPPPPRFHVSWTDLAGLHTADAAPAPASRSSAASPPAARPAKKSRWGPPPLQPSMTF